MNQRESVRLDRELDEFVQCMVDGMGRPERRQAMADYVTGLLLDGERKSILPMAARLVDSADEIEAMRQRLQQAVSVSTWSDAEMLRRLALKLDSELPGVEAFVIDDTGLPKKGRFSVGVARQYSGTLGRIDNCQVMTSLHLAGEAGSGCIGMRLFLPEVWASDLERRRSVGVPDDLEFSKKWQIALGQIDDALAWGVRRHVVLADAGYGEASEFRDGLTARGLRYLVAVPGVLRIWPPGAEPTVPTRTGAPGRPRTRHRDDDAELMAIQKFAAEIGRSNYRTVTWRQGSKGKQSSQFYATRVRTAVRFEKGHPPSDEQWLLCEWPDDEPAPTKFYLSTLPETTSLKSLVRLARLRWRVERDYQELKQEIGLDHFEGRTWRGLHHHATLCAVAHGFLALRRALFPPEEDAVDAS
jgi:SRSO17 transposase